MYSGWWPKWRKSRFASPPKLGKVGRDCEVLHLSEQNLSVTNCARKIKLIGRGRLRCTCKVVCARKLSRFLRAEDCGIFKVCGPRVQRGVAKMQEFSFCAPPKTVKMVFLGGGQRARGSRVRAPKRARACQKRESDRTRAAQVVHQGRRGAFCFLFLARGSASGHRRGASDVQRVVAKMEKISFCQPSKTWQSWARLRGPPPQ